VPSDYLRGVAATLLGTTKIVKTVEAIATTIAALRTTSTRSRIAIMARVAIADWAA
jgi:hypothetical protein